ncbi:MAG: BMC domain-containing protein [Elusimicrobiota bacterium]
MEALGMIETRSLSAMIEAADTMMKTANVKFSGFQKTGAGIVTVSVRGSVADCRLAVDAGVASAGRVAEVLRGHVIPYPASDIEDILPVRI